MKSGDLPKVVPVFPLEGALLLPRARLPLNIFEPRYLAMFEEALRTPERMIAMIQPVSADPAETRLSRIGCAGRISAFAETGDGRYMITLTGISRFRLREEVEGFTPYRRFHVDWHGFERDLGAVEQDPDLDRPAFLALLRRYFEAKSLGTDWSQLEHAEDEMLINMLSMLCPFEGQDKQALLEAPCLSSRRQTLITLIDFALRSRGQGPEEMLQ